MGSRRVKHDWATEQHYIKRASWVAQQWRIHLQWRRHKRCRFNPWVGKILWRKVWQATPVLLSEKSHGQRSLEGYSPWDHKELDTMKQHNMHSITLKKKSKCHDHLKPLPFLGTAWVAAKQPQLAPALSSLLFPIDSCPFGAENPQWELWLQHMSSVALLSVIKLGRSFLSKLIWFETIKQCQLQTGKWAPFCFL